MVFPVVHLCDLCAFALNISKSRKVGDTVRVRFVDDGDGFDTTQSRRGYGLVGMRERAEALAGYFEVRSKTGAGTIVEAGFPLR